MDVKCGYLIVFRQRTASHTSYPGSLLGVRQLAGAWVRDCCFTYLRLRHSLCRILNFDSHPRASVTQATHTLKMFSLPTTLS